MHPTTSGPDTQPQLIVRSVGIGHGDIPHGDVLLDVRPWFRNPYISPELRDLNGRDQAVIASVLGADGAAEFIRHQFDAVRVLVGLGRGTVTVIVACAGGRHRSVVLADHLVYLARSAGLRAEVEHRDVGKPLLPPRAAS